MLALRHAAPAGTPGEREEPAWRGRGGAGRVSCRRVRDTDQQSGVRSDAGEATEAIKEMARAPRGLERPLGLFTISSPHAGARLTQVGTLNQLHREMKPDSDLMNYLWQWDQVAGYE